MKVSSAPPRVGGMEAAGRLDVLSVVPRGDGQGAREAFEKLKSDGSLDKLAGFEGKTKLALGEVDAVKAYPRGEAKCRLGPKMTKDQAALP